MSVDSTVNGLNRFLSLMGKVGKVTASSSPYLALFSTLFNFGSELAQKSYEKNLQKQIFNREDTTYQRTAQDMRSAGLSPLGMEATNGSGAVVPSTSPSMDTSQMVAAAQLMSQLNINDAQVKNIEEDTRGKKIENDYKEEANPKTIEKLTNEIQEIKDNIRKIKSETEKNRAETKLVAAQTQKSKLEAKKLETETGLKSAEMWSAFWDGTLNSWIVSTSKSHSEGGSAKGGLKIFQGVGLDVGASGEWADSQSKTYLENIKKFSTTAAQRQKVQDICGDHLPINFTVSPAGQFNFTLDGVNYTVTTSGKEFIGLFN